VPAGADGGDAVQPPCPGKRLRPLLVILAAEACGERDTEALAAACAVEMIHTYSLVTTTCRRWMTTISAADCDESQAVW